MTKNKALRILINSSLKYMWSYKKPITKELHEEIKTAIKKMYPYAFNCNISGYRIGEFYWASGDHYEE